MVTHGLPRLRLIVFFDGGDDGKMRIDGSLTPGWGLERLLPAVAQDIQQSGKEFFDGVVVGALADREVEFSVRIHAGGSPLELLALLEQPSFQQRDVLCGPSLVSR